MELCVLAKVVFLLSVINVSFDIYLLGISAFSLLMNILFTIFAVSVTNWSCYNQTNNWVAWVMVIFAFIATAVMLYIMKYPNEELNKQVIEEERKNRLHIQSKINELA
jgi:Ca2+/Na+ antiporter